MTKSKEQMITAKKAKEMSEKNKLPAILLQIEDAAKFGRTYTVTRVIPSKTEIAKLKKLGFSVQVIKSAERTKISW